jgi:hypothetical protein
MSVGSPPVIEHLRNPDHHVNNPLGVTSQSGVAGGLLFATRAGHGCHRDRLSFVKGTSISVFCNSYKTLRPLAARVKFAEYHTIKCICKHKMLSNA